MRAEIIVTWVDGILARAAMLIPRRQRYPLLTNIDTNVAMPAAVAKQIHHRQAWQVTALLLAGLNILMLSFPGGQSDEQVEYRVPMYLDWIDVIFKPKSMLTYLAVRAVADIKLVRFL